MNERLLRRAVQDIVGEFARAVNHRADGGAVKVISSEGESRIAVESLGEELRTAVMIEVVLRDGAGPDLHMGHDEVFREIQNAFEIAMDQVLQALKREFCV